jgi:hypothetical protein
METRDETIARLRQKLGREPTEIEIKAGRDNEWRKLYADMAVSAATLADD